MTTEKKLHAVTDNTPAPETTTNIPATRVTSIRSGKTRSSAMASSM